MREILYSIIIPIYNAETTLKCCIESVLNQTEKNFELILVNDGSADASGEICEFYKKKDDHIKVFHQTNRGVSAARNVGLENAEGRYIIFVDSDDYLERDCLKYYNKTTENLVVSATKIYSPKKEIEGILREPEGSYQIVNEEHIIEFLKKWYSIQVWGKRYCRKKIEEVHLRFDEAISYGEDTIFNVLYASEVKKVEIIEDVTYNFCKSKNESLSKRGDEWFTSYTNLQKKLYLNFQETLKVQEYLKERYWWVLEQELVKCANLDTSFKIKCRLISNILSEKFLLECMEEPQVAVNNNPIVKFAIKHNVAWLVAVLYMNH